MGCSGKLAVGEQAGGGMRGTRRSAWVWAAGMFLTGCASWPQRFGSQPCCITVKPGVSRPPIAWHLFDVTVTAQLKQVLDLVRLSRRLAGLPVRATNLRQGEVADGTFFTNRDPAGLSPEQIRWGPTRPDDVAQGPLTITKPKTEGKTPGFFATDSRGGRFLIKLDPANSPELLSGAEVVSSKLLHALGYHVPSYEVVWLDPQAIAIKPGLMVRGPRDEPRPFTQADVQKLTAPRLQDGRVRAVASRIVEGEILGPARFAHFRDCAEMRALKLAYAWLNNIDAKDHNSLLVWDGSTTVGYLIDFGTSLGGDAGLAGPKDHCAGWRYVVDWRTITWELLTLGIYRPICDYTSPVVSPAIGRFSTQLHPTQWKPYAPNLAFSAMDDEDARWIARRMERLSRKQIEAAVEAGQYSRPEDASYLARTLLERRDLITHAFPPELPGRRRER